MMRAVRNGRDFFEQKSRIDLHNILPSRALISNTQYLYEIMPSTSTSTSTTRQRPTSSPEATRTGIIVGVIVGVLALFIIAYILINRRRKQGVKAGTKIGAHVPRVKQDKDLEVGVIQEPVPVYRKELRGDERRLAVGGEGEER